MSSSACESPGIAKRSIVTTKRGRDNLATESLPILNFYMGKNTPERKDYIMDKLVVPGGGVIWFTELTEPAKSCSCR